MSEEKKKTLVAEIDAEMDKYRNEELTMEQILERMPESIAIYNNLVPNEKTDYYLNKK